ncbi:MAG: hypothetical protein K6F76_07525 [Clostridiales bacterium]|nr:hypothetical protein [Clostridiales bacterium]
MYKKLIGAIAVLLLAVITSSCSQSDEIAAGDSLSAVLTGEYSFTPGQDDDICLSSYNNIAVAEGGYYFTTFEHHMLYYFDKATKKVIPVCNRPECSHDSTDCNAYIGEIQHYPGLWYYNGKLYVLGYKSGIMGLYTVSKDGSEHSRLCDLSETGREFTMETTIHRNYAYFSIDNGKNTAEVYRSKLEANSEPELIWKFEGKKAVINGLIGYDNGVFVSYSYYEEGESENEIYLLAYYSNNGKVYEIPLKDFYGQFAVCKGSIIYGSPTQVMKYDSSNGEISVYYDKETCAVSYDGDYIYLDNETALFDASIADNTDYDTSKRHIIVKDMYGNTIDDIHIKTDGFCYFGDRDYLLIDVNEEYASQKTKQIEIGDMIKGITSNFLTKLEALDKSQIGAEKHEWIVLKEWDIDSIIG